MIKTLQPRLLSILVPLALLSTNTPLLAAPADGSTNMIEGNTENAYIAGHQNTVFLSNNGDDVVLVGNQNILGKKYKKDQASVSTVVFGSKNQAPKIYDSVIIGYGNNLPPNLSKKDDNYEMGYATNTIAIGLKNFGRYLMVGEDNVNYNAAVAMGKSNTSFGQNAITIGTSNKAFDTNAIAVGFASKALKNDSMAFGASAEADKIGAIALGNASQR